MKLHRQKVPGGFNRYRLILTLGVAVLLPAAGLIFLNFSQLRAFERDKVLEAAIHREFQETLALTEKRMDKKAYAMVDEVREQFPDPYCSETDVEKQLDEILSKKPWITHAFLYDGKNFVLRTQPAQMMSDRYVHEEHDMMAESYPEWFRMDKMAESMHKRSRTISFMPSLQTKRMDGEKFSTSALFVFPSLPDKNVLGGIMFDPYYLKKQFFPEVLEEFATKKPTDQGGYPIAMVLYPSDMDGGYEPRLLAKSSGWKEGKPEVSRKLDDMFRGLALGIKYQGTSVEELGKTWLHRSLVILGILSLMTVGGLFLTKHVVGKEMALARLKSDFVSNVSHELRTPLALIRLYAETLELGRINTAEKKEQYYRIIRKESERLTALINNILDFSRIEAGRKEYEFRETDIAELVRNTLESYRYQIEQQGFALEESIDTNLPVVTVDREAIARALVNLVNNALKYSSDEKFLGVKLYREDRVVKLEVADHGIGIARRDLTKIFEKFYRAGDPLVHNTKGSGLGLSLVRHITQAHGGDIAVESTPGKGSRFILSLPLVTA